MVFLVAALALVCFVVLAGFVLTGRISASDDSSFPKIPSRIAPSTCSLFTDNSEGSGGGDGIMEAGKLTCCVIVQKQSALSKK